MIAERVPAAEAMVWTMLFSAMVWLRTLRRIATSISAAVNTRVMRPPMMTARS